MSNLLNADNWNNYIQPLVADVSAAVLFGLGYYIFKAFSDSDESSSTLKKQFLSTLSKWEQARTLQKYNSLINTNSNKGLDAFEIMDMMGTSRVVPDIVTYNSLLEMSFRLDQTIQARKLYEEMSDFTSPVQPDIVTYNILLKGSVTEIKESYENQADLSTAFKRFQGYISDCQSKSLAFNEITYNTVIDACIEAGESDLSWKYLNEMKENGIKPDLYTYATIIKSIRNSSICSEESLGKVLEIFSMINEGKCEGLIADEVIYNSVLDTCLKYSKIDTMQSIFSEMKRKGVAPSMITYSIMIKGYGQAYDLENAVELFDTMVNGGITPNEVVYGCLLNCAVRCSNLELMKEIYIRMKAQGIEANLIIYTTMIKGYNKMKRFDLAFGLFDEMISERKVSPNIVIYNAILDCCVESKNYEKMIDIYDEVKQSEGANLVQPNMITYSTVIKGYCKWGNMEKAQDIYKFLIEHQFKLDEVLFNTLADGYAREKNEAKAIEIFNDMKSLSIPRSNVIFSIMIKMFSVLGKQETALEYYQLMKSERIKASLVTYTTLIQMFIKVKKIKEAIEVYEEIKNSGMKLDHVIYNFCINGCVFNRHLEKGIEILLESVRCSVKLPEETYNNTLEYLISNKFMKPNERVGHCASLAKALKEKNYQISLEVYTKLMRVLYKNNEKENTTQVESYKENCKTNKNTAMVNQNKQKESLQKTRKHNYK